MGSSSSKKSYDNKKIARNNATTPPNTPLVQKKPSSTTTPALSDRSPPSTEVSPPANIKKPPRYSQPTASSEARNSRNILDKARWEEIDRISAQIREKEVGKRSSFALGRIYHLRLKIEELEQENQILRNKNDALNNALKAAVSAKTIPSTTKTTANPLARPAPQTKKPTVFGSDFFNKTKNCATEKSTTQANPTNKINTLKEAAYKLIEQLKEINHGDQRLQKTYDQSLKQASRMTKESQLQEEILRLNKLLENKKKNSLFGSAAIQSAPKKPALPLRR